MNKYFVSKCFQNRSKIQKCCNCYFEDKKRSIMSDHAKQKHRIQWLQHSIKSNCCLFVDCLDYCFQYKTMKNLKRINFKN